MLPLFFLLGGAAAAAEQFVWGTSTAAYQVEGYRSIDGRRPSIWDAFDTANVSDVIASVRPDGTNRVEGDGSVADEDYKRYQESVDLTKELGFGAARLSISWPRVVSYDNSTVGTINREGLSHYSEVINAYVENGIKVAVTMFHWDLPLDLEEFAFYSGCESAWLCDWMPGVFEDYAEVLISNLQNVTYWITLNEPLTIVSNGYSGNGGHAPGRCSSRSRCYAGDDSEAFAAAKTMILAHARAFRKWEELGRPGEGCGITLNGDYRIAFTEEDSAAAERDLEWQLPLFYDPIFYGRWPASVKRWMPKWTQKELDVVHGSHDGKHFFTNTYTTYFVRDENDGKCTKFPCSKSESSGFNFTSGVPIGVPSTNNWLFDYGAGIRKLLNYYDQRYPNRTFVVTENGWGNQTGDEQRCSYYRDYITNVSAAVVEDGVDVAAYFAWSLLDNYEWADGYATRFGIVHVDYATQKRTPKNSARWFKAHVTSTTSLQQTLQLPGCPQEEKEEGTIDQPLTPRDDHHTESQPQLEARYLVLPTLAVLSILYAFCTLAHRQVGFVCRFFTILLRRCCVCGKCEDVSTRQFTTTSLPRPRKKRKSGGKYYRKLSPAPGASRKGDDDGDLV